MGTEEEHKGPGAPGRGPLTARGLQAAPAAAVRSPGWACFPDHPPPACPKPGDVVVLSPSCAQHKITTLTCLRGTAQWRATLTPSSPELSHRPKQKLCPHQMLAPSAPPASLCLRVCLLQGPHVNRSTVLVFLCLACLTERDILQLHLCCSGRQHLLRLTGQMTLCCVSRSCFADPSSVVDICVASYVLATMDGA